MSQSKVILVANVGERDLYYNVGDDNQPNFCHFELGKDDEKQVAKHLGCKNGARYISETILQRLQQNSNEVQRLRYPILKTVLDDGVLASGKILDQLVLIATDQPSSTPEQHRCRDSLFTVQVLKRLIEQDYSRRIRAIEIVSYQENPANRERSYGFFGKCLSQLASGVQEFHASLSGGVPALNDSLQEQALRLYKDKCHFYEVIPPSEQESRQGAPKGTLQPVSAKPFLKDLAISIIEQLLSRYDYSGALEVLKMFSAVKFWDKDVEAVLEYAERRGHLDFERAKRALESYASSTPPISCWYRAVNNRDKVTPLLEILYVAQLQHKTENYADFIWRVSAFSEYLKDELLRGQLSNPIETKVLNINDRLSTNLRELRNKVVHDLKGISRDEIEDKFTPHEDIARKFSGETDKMKLLMYTLEELARMVIQLKQSNSELRNPYDEINDWLRNKLWSSQ